MIGFYLQMVAALALVIFLIYAFAFAYKKKQNGSGLIKLLAYQALGQKMGIAALKIDNEILVFGVTPTDFKLIKKIDGRNYQTEEVSSISDKIMRLRKIKEGLQ